MTVLLTVAVFVACVVALVAMRQWVGHEPRGCAGDPRRCAGCLGKRECGGEEGAG